MLPVGPPSAERLCCHKSALSNSASELLQARSYIVSAIFDERIFSYLAIRDAQVLRVASIFCALILILRPQFPSWRLASFSAKRCGVVDPWSWWTLVHYLLCESMTQLPLHSILGSPGGKFPLRRPLTTRLWKPRRQWNLQGCALPANGKVTDFKVLLNGNRRLGYREYRC